MNKNQHEGTAARVDAAKEEAAIAERRRFLLACGKFAAITPPAMTFANGGLDSAIGLYSKHYHDVHPPSTGTTMPVT